MATPTDITTGVPVREPSRHIQHQPSLLAAAATATTGAGMAFIVGHDGTPAWQMGRVVVCLAVVLQLRAILSQPRPQPRPDPALALGLLPVPLGVGNGGAHLAKTGLQPMTLAGIASFIGGLVLVGAGATWLFGSTRRWLRIPALGAVLLVLVVLTWSLGQAVSATNVPRLRLGSATPADAGFAYRDVTFPAADGVTLSGWYLPSRNGAAVVLLHGAGSTRSNVLDHAVVLARHGYGVLLYDARGHGRSDGRAMDFGWYGDADMAGAVSFVEHQDGVDSGRIAAVGMSMGGEEAIGAAATIEDIRAVVAEGATNRVTGDKAWLSDEFGIRGAASEWLEGLTYASADVLTAASAPITLHDAVRAAAPRPILLIAAGSVADEPRAGRYIQSASPGTVTLWVVSHTGHTDALGTHPREWEARVIAFLDHALGLPAG